MYINRKFNYKVSRKISYYYKIVKDKNAEMELMNSYMIYNSRLLRIYREFCFCSHICQGAIIALSPISPLGASIMPDRNKNLSKSYLNIILANTLKNTIFLYFLHT